MAQAVRVQVPLRALLFSSEGWGASCWLSEKRSGFPAQFFLSHGLIEGGAVGEESEPHQITAGLSMIRTTQGCSLA